MAMPSPLQRLAGQVQTNPTADFGNPVAGDTAPTSMDLSKLTLAEARFVGYYITQPEDSKSVKLAKEQAGIYDPNWDIPDSPEVAKVIAFHETTKLLAGAILGTKEFLAFKAYEVYEMAMTDGNLKVAIAALQAVNEFTGASKQDKAPEDRTIRFNLYANRTKTVKEPKKAPELDELALTPTPKGRTPEIGEL